MDANWITAVRTGAVAVHSINLFAKKNFSSIGYIGLGNTARASLLILAEKLKDKEIQINLLKYKGQEELFKNRFKNYLNLKFTYMNTYREIIENSDVIVSSVTYFKEDICSDDTFKEGTTVIPIHTRGFSNCDLFFDKIYADDREHVKNFKYFNKYKKFAEVADVVNNKAQGRENDKERIIVYNIGIAIHDINFASKIFNMIDKSKLQKVDFKEPKEKFWI